MSPNFLENAIMDLHWNFILTQMAALALIQILSARFRIWFRVRYDKKRGGRVTLWSSSVAKALIDPAV